MSARRLTQEECREQFLETVRSCVDYWENESYKPDVRDKLEGLAFSILVILDGGAYGLPQFQVIPDPHPTDKASRKVKGENWWPNNCDIAGSLHESFFKRKSMLKQNSI